MLEILFSIQLLTCTEYDFLVSGIPKTSLSRFEQVELRLNVMRMTEPSCFYTEDAND